MKYIPRENSTIRTWVGPICLKPGESIEIPETDDNRETLRLAVKLGILRIVTVEEEKKAPKKKATKKAAKKVGKKKAPKKATRKSAKKKATKKAARKSKKA